MIAQSRLALVCDKFIQAAWLVALIVAPLYFNIYSSRVFEPDKIALVRTLALGMGAAWLILRAERWQGNARASNQGSRLSGARVLSWLREMSAYNPLSIPALLLLAAYILSTLLSVSPTVSFFGSYQRQQGLYTFSAYLVIFLLAASELRTRADIERAVTIALVASFPIAFYGIIQHYFLDPLPWVGDVTTRVASNLGNSIFIGAFLILAMPLALLRLIQSSDRIAQQAPSIRSSWLAVAVGITVALFAAAWGLCFDLGAKNAIESSYTGTLTPEQLASASTAFQIALLISIGLVLAWVGGAFLLKQRIANFVTTVLYALLFAVQLVALLFSQSRGPLLGLLGGMFVFGVLVALVRGARWLALGAVGSAAVVMLFLALLNIPNSPLAPLRAVPYIGRLGRVFELEGGTGRVRVLIWEGALQLALPHSPLWSPTGGEDVWNPMRPLVGYGPETMYVAYNRFYPAELGQIESRNATPDRSHNETFDALVTTGLFGFVAENILFLVIFYLAVKWLGLAPTRRARNAFIALWFGGGILTALVFGAVLGWQFVGVALPGGMMLGFFAYLIAFALRRSSGGSARAGANEGGAPPNALWFIALTALFVAHFIEIHFGIAIVSTRVYFWFFAAVFVALGTRGAAMPDVQLPGAQAEPKSQPRQTQFAPTPAESPHPRRARQGRVASAASRKGDVRSSQPRTTASRIRVSAAPLITLAVLVGLVLAIMGFDYINTNNVGALESGTVSGLDIVWSALIIKGTTAGGMSSPAMLWLFVATLAIALGVCSGEWGCRYRLSWRDWGTALFLFVILAFAVFSGLVFYHVLLISAPGAATLDALLGSVILFTIYMLVVAALTAVTLLFDETLPALWVRRATNWVVMPVLLVVAAVLILASNIDPVRADMLYKQAASLTGENNTASIEMFQRALALQPQQDYYLLFLGRAYLDAAKATSDAHERTRDLEDAEQALLRAREINPYNTDHSANLARLAQARGGLETDAAAQIAAYKQASEYFNQATRLSPNTAHLYDQHAQALLEYADVLQKQKDAEGAALAQTQAQEQIERALAVDDTFCLTYAVRALSRSSWRERVSDALDAIRLAPRCGDVFISEGLAIAVNALARAGEQATRAGEANEFESRLTAASEQVPSLEVFTTLANFYSKAGRIADAIVAIDRALATIPSSDTNTRKRYEDFRFNLVELSKALDAARAAPNDALAQRTLGELWLARGQFEFALPAYQKAADLNPDDYAAQRQLAMLLIIANRLPEAAEQLARAQALAPAGDQSLLQRLAQVVTDVQQAQNEQALASLEALAKEADTKDYALVTALRALAERVGGAG